MILAAVFILVFSAAIGLYITKNLLEIQRHANAVDSAEKIYNAADILSAGAIGSTRSLWVNIPEGYSITFEDDKVNLKKADAIIGTPLSIDGVKITGDPLTGKKHLQLKYSAEPGSKITLTELS